MEKRVCGSGKNDQVQLQDLRGECATFQEQLGHFQGEIEQRLDNIRKEIDFRFDRFQQNVDQLVDRRVDRYLSTVDGQLRTVNVDQARSDANEIFQTLRNQIDQLHRETLEAKEMARQGLEQEKQEVARILQEVQNQFLAQRAANHDLTEQVRLHVQTHSDRVEQISQQVRVDRSDQMLLWSQLDQSEKQLRQ